LTEASLLVIWAGDYRQVLEKMVTWKNIKFVGAKYGDELVELVQNSLGLVFPGEEDFWIVPIEVMAAGKPVFAYEWWWLLESVIKWVTWEFFTEKDWKDFVERFREFDENNKKWKYQAEACVEQAKKFDKKVFEKRILELVEE
jgi:glycosyltransferase involved in cell wall biosynthesis